jgi:hypothetical protein
VRLAAGRAAMVEGTASQESHAVQDVASLLVSCVRWTMGQGRRVSPSGATNLGPSTFGKRDCGRSHVMDYVQRVRPERRCFAACVTCPCIGRQLMDGSWVDSSLWTVEQQWIDQLLALTRLSQSQRRLVAAT